MIPAKAATAFALLLAACTHSQPRAPEVAITGAWARATVAGESSAAAYLTLANRGDSDERLIQVSTPIGRAGVHSTTMDNGVMRMRHVAVLVVPAHSTIEFKPGGMHVMITGVKQPLKAGTSFPLTLRFDVSGARTATVNVQPANSNGMAM